MKLSSNNYKMATTDNWEGKKDGDIASYWRWNQVIELLDLNNPLPDLKNTFVFVGFACDEGVRRNNGRTGAVKAPDSIRNILKNLPVHHDNHIKIYDAGDIICKDQDLENAQARLSEIVKKVVLSGGFPIVLGGGHEVAFGSYKGLYDSVNENIKIGIINFDAHFDLREPGSNGISSGTGFYQMAEIMQQSGRSFYYLPIGIQKISNTRKLFETADALNVKYIEAHLINAENRQHMEHTLQQYIDTVDAIYLSIDLDVFSAAEAPGVSATAFNGINAGPVLFSLLRLISNSGKLKIFDIAELNPEYDIDNRTAKLAANIIFKMISGI